MINLFCISFSGDIKPDTNKAILKNEAKVLHKDICHLFIHNFDKNLILIIKN